jgi:hypothetical protein
MRYCTKHRKKNQHPASSSIPPDLKTNVSVPLTTIYWHEKKIFRIFIVQCNARSTKIKNYRYPSQTLGRLASL